MSTVDAGLRREEALAAAETNMDFFAMLCIPEIIKYLFPPTFLAIWQWITANLAIERGKQRLAIGLPRGFGKTIVMKLVVLYTIFFTDRKFILIVCNTAQLAENFIADVSDAMDSPNIRTLFGNWRLSVEKDTLHLKKFSFRGRSVTLAGLGAGTSLRGLNIKYVRPDFILMDDMQSKEEAESPIEAARVHSWMIGTLMKAAAPERCLYVFVGNMYPYPGSILKKLKHASTWLTFITAAILEDGKSIWEELKPVEELLQELEHDIEQGQADVFYAEVMNDENAGVKHGIDITLIKDAPDWLIDDMAPAGFVVIDPSMGKKKSDDLAIGGFLIHDGKPMLRELDVDKIDPKECVKRTLVMMMKWQINVCFVEAVAYQASLAFWLDYFTKELGIQGFQFIEIYPGHGSKNSRIYQMLKSVAKVEPEVLLHKSVRSQFVAQAVQWNPLKTDNKDDILDLPTYCPRIMLEHAGNLMRTFELTMSQNTSKAVFGHEMALAF